MLMSEATIFPLSPSSCSRIAAEYASSPVAHAPDHTVTGSENSSRTLPITGQTDAMRNHPVTGCLILFRAPLMRFPGRLNSFPAPLTGTFFSGINLGIYVLAQVNAMGARLKMDLTPSVRFSSWGRDR